MPDFRSSKPGFRVTQPSAQSIAAGAQDLEFPTVVFEDPAGWDGTSLYVVDRPGLYLIGVQAGRAAVASSSTIIVRARVNGSTVQSFQSLSTTAGVVAMVTVPVHLEAGDEIGGQVTFHPSLAADTIPAQTQLWGLRLGPKRWT